MMENAGFRVTLLNSIGVATPKKYYIYVDLKRCSLVGDLECHIRNIFQIPEQIYLSIGNNILPTNEYIMVIQPDDVLRLNLEYVNDYDIAAHHGKLNLNPSTCLPNFISSPKPMLMTENIEIPKPSEPPLPPVKKRWKGKINKEVVNGVAACLEMLRKKKDDLEAQKEEMLESTPVKLQHEEIETSNVENEKLGPSEAEGDLAIERTENLKLKRRRKRKHKSKNRNTTALEDEELDPQYDMKITGNNPKQNSHIIFSGSEEEDDSGSLQVTAGNCNDSDISSEILEKQSNKTTQEESETWKLNLLALAKEPVEKKVFHRNSLDKKGKISTDQDVICLDNFNKSLKDFDPLQYPIVTKVRKNDIILFKMLKIGPDYSPTVSGNIMGKITSVDENSQQVSVLVLKGSEELEAPGGKFYVGEEGDSGRTQILDLRIGDLIESRLVFP